MTLGQFALGTMYFMGHGVPKDYAQAARWYLRAAEQGIAGAQFDLGFMYDMGLGVPQDYVTAHMWYNIAAANGDADAVERREYLANRMSSDAIAEAQRRARACFEAGYEDCD